MKKYWKLIQQHLGVDADGIPGPKTALALLEEAARQAGACGVALSRAFTDGGAGAADLAHAVVAACKQPSEVRLLYPDEMSLAAKLATLVVRLWRPGHHPLGQGAPATGQTLGRGPGSPARLHGQDAALHQP